MVSLAGQSFFMHIRYWLPDLMLLSDNTSPHKCILLLPAVAKQNWTQWCFIGSNACCSVTWNSDTPCKYKRQWELPNGSGSWLAAAGWTSWSWWASPPAHWAFRIIWIPRWSCCSCGQQGGLWPHAKELKERLNQISRESPVESSAVLYTDSTWWTGLARTAVQRTAGHT